MTSNNDFFPTLSILQLVRWNKNLFEKCKNNLKLSCMYTGEIYVSFMSCQFEDGKVPCRDMNEKEDEILWEAGTQEGVSSLPNSVNSAGRCYIC